VERHCEPRRISMNRLCVVGVGRLWRIAALAALISLMCISIPRQGDSFDPPSPDEYRISVNVGLVVLPVTVTDGKGKAVSGLDKESFQVFDDGRPQKIALFEADDVPVTVGLVVDGSASMRSKRPEVMAASEAFARSSNPHDEMFVVNFNQDASLGLPQGVPFTSNVGELLEAVSRNPAAGNTALYDGIGVALKHIKAGTASRKALIVISDGGDNSSDLSLQEALQRARVSSTQIYTIGVFDNRAEAKDASVLSRLAKVTGGRAYFTESTSQIAAICQQIASDLRAQYTLGYHPSNSNDDGAYHAIRVTAKATGDRRLHVSTRAGYWVPVEPQSAPPA